MASQPTKLVTTFLLSVPIRATPLRTGTEVLLRPLRER
jgi:hypothetical protein